MRGMQKGATLGVAVMMGGLMGMAAAGPSALSPAGGPVDQWTVAGPFPNPALEEPGPDGVGRGGWNIDYLESIGGESAAVLDPAVPIRAGDHLVTPRRVPIGPLSTINMQAALGITADHDSDYTLAYAQAIVEVPEPGEYFFLLGVDDAAKFFVNGEPVFGEWSKGQGITPGQYQFTHTLRAGTNTILIKLDNNTGPWGFSLDVGPVAQKEVMMQRLVEGPEDFTRFVLEGFPRESAALSRYNWRFFDGRLGNFHTLFVREYMTMADVWRANAFERKSGRAIQDIIRGWWKITRQDPDGYIQTHQHFSHCHDGGWPFPLWPQVYGGSAGYTAGWHFQDSGPGWVWEYKMVHPNTPVTGQMATEAWRVSGAASRGMTGNFWTLVTEAPDALLTSPEGTVIDAQNAPFIQLRWRRDGQPRRGVTPFLEWQREGDTDWSADRRMLIFDYNSEFSDITGFRHAIVPLYRHPLWNGRIKAFRVAPAPGEVGVTVEIDSIFTCYDTRKPYNNLFFITGAWEYFRWTGDVDFLHTEINRLRASLRYFQETFSTRELGHVRNQWTGHDGIAGWYRDEAGNKVPNPGHGIGNNYYDLLPFGWDDMYNTAQYYYALLCMARIEELVDRNPGWALPAGGLAFDPAELRAHAERVKRVANEKFWNPETGRYFGSIDRNGRAYDYGFTFVGLEAIFYGIAEDDKARSVMDWISGRRLVEGDTSIGEDIYAFRFGPRATTRRNIEWYGQGWTNPEHIKWGNQIQDGGAVLGMAIYDLMARLRVYGPDDAWQRLKELIAWDIEVQEAGGYRKYYESLGIRLQGGGTAGGIGIDFEFLESSLPPLVVLWGFLGLDPQGDRLHIAPQLPSELPSITMTNIAYHGVVLDATAARDAFTLVVKDRPVHPLTVSFAGPHRLDGRESSEFRLTEPGTYRFEIVR